MPDRNVEYLFYQSLLGAWPPGLDPSDVEGMKSLAERIEAYMIKAVREGKEQSSWSNPNAAYEAALQRFVTMVLDATRTNPFLAEFHAFVESLPRLGAINSLSQLVLKLTVPGVPDIYQGGELWDFSLVDPDNRRPVDWNTRRVLLDEIVDVSVARSRRTLAGRPREAVCVRGGFLSCGDRIRSCLPKAIISRSRSTAKRSRHLCAFRAEATAAQRWSSAVPRLVHQLYRGAAERPTGARPRSASRLQENGKTCLPAAEFTGRGSAPGNRPVRRLSGLRADGRPPGRSRNLL